MAKRFHPDPSVHSCSVGGHVFQRQADDSFDIPAEHLPALEAHGFVAELPKPPAPAKAPAPAAAEPAAAPVEAQIEAPAVEQPRKHGRRR